MASATGNVEGGGDTATRESSDIERGNVAGTGSIQGGHMAQQNGGIGGGGTMAGANVIEKPEFKRRQAQYIPICLCIGTGMLFHTGLRLYYGGPGALFMSYCIVATIVYAVLITTGEMISLLPIRGALFMLPYRFLNKQLGLACGLLTTFGFAVDIGQKAAIFAAYIAYWQPLLSTGARVGSIIGFFSQYWGSIVTSIIGIIMSAVVISGGGGPAQLLGTNLNFQPVPCAQNQIGDQCLLPPGFGSYWKSPTIKPFIWSGATGRAAAVFYCLQVASFSFAGSEMVTLLANETERQKVSLPIVVRRIANRIIPLYLFAVLALTITVSADDPILALNSAVSESQAPPFYPGGFVVMALRAGIPELAGFINFVMLVAAASTAAADVYMVSRCLQALSDETLIPPTWFRRPQGSQRGVPLHPIPRGSTTVPSPITPTSTEELADRGCFGLSQYFGGHKRSLLAAWIFGLLAFLSFGTNSYDFFEFLLEATTTATLIPWVAICLSYIYFQKRLKQDFEYIKTEPKSQSWLQPYLAYYGLVGSTFLVGIQGVQSFSRGYSYWVSAASYWGWSLAPWSVIAAFVLFVFFFSIVFQANPFAFRGVGKANYLQDMAPELPRKDEIESIYERAWLSFLDSL